MAWKRGAKVHVVKPVDFVFAFDIAGKQIVSPSGIADALGSAELADAFNGATRAAVIVGAIAENGIHASAIRKAAKDFASANNAALCRIPHGANALGLAPHGVLPVSRDANAILAHPPGAFVVYGIQPGLDFAQPATAANALGGAPDGKTVGGG